MRKRADALSRSDKVSGIGGRRVHDRARGDGAKAVVMVMVVVVCGRERVEEREKAAILFPVSREHFRSPSRSPARTECPRAPERSPSAIIFKLNAPVRPVIYCRQFSYNPPGDGSPYLPPFRRPFRASEARARTTRIVSFCWGACRATGVLMIFDLRFRPAGILDKEPPRARA